MVHNHRQQYCNDIIIQQAYLQKKYDRDNGISHGMIHSGIPTPEKQATTIIPLEKIIVLEKTNRFIFNFLKERK